MARRGSQKIKTIKQLAPIIRTLKQEGKKIVLTAGVFDLVHHGHIRHFREARRLGDVLVVSVVDDEFVAKGPGRPFFNQNIRLDWLTALEDVDFVVLNGDYGPHKVMRKIKPQIFTKGDSDKKRFADPNSGLWKDKKVMDEIGGKLVLTKELPNQLHSQDIFKLICAKKEERRKILFICTNNMIRSPTCEDIFKDSILYEAKSAGTAPHATVRVTQEMIDWSDVIVVMSERADKHCTYLKKNFNLHSKSVYDLDIEDSIFNQRGQPELVEDLKKRLKKYFKIPLT